MTGAPAAGLSGAGALEAVTGSVHLVELARGDIEDETADGVLVRHERAGLDPGLVLYRLLERVVGEGEHAAVGVVDQDDLPGAEQSLADGQRPDLVVGDDPACVADDVGLTVAQAENRVD